MTYRLSFLLLGVLLGLAAWGIPGSDPDIGWHLLGGAWTLEHSAVPRDDFINTFNPRWHDYSWLAEILMFLTYKYLGGFEGLRFFVAGFAAIIMVLVVDLIYTVRRTPPHPLTAFISLLCSWQMVEGVFTARPQMLAILGLLITLIILHRRGVKWELPLIFAITVLLVGVHVYWFLIPFLWGCFRILPHLTRRRRSPGPYGWGGLLLLLSAGLISPYGIIDPHGQNDFIFLNYALVFDLLLLPAKIREMIGEMAGISTVAGLIPISMVAVLIIYVRTFRYKRFLVNPGPLVCGMISLLLASRAIKFIPVCGVFILPALVPALDTLVKYSPVSKKFLSLRWGRFIFNSSIAFSILAAALNTTNQSPWLNDVNNKLKEYLPYRACGYIASQNLPFQDGRNHTRVLTHFNHGGWCRWIMYEAAPQKDIRVTTDGRVQSVPWEHYVLMNSIYNSVPPWLGVMESWKPDAILASRDTSLAETALLLPDKWRLAYEDKFFRVFLPQQN